MALIQCAECGEKVSDKAKACPGCGAPTPKKGSAFPILLGAVGIAVAVFIFVAAAGSGSESKPAYTGRLKIDAGTEYVFEEAPSPIAGPCAGWNAVSIQKPADPAAGMRSLMCWRRNGSEIETQGPHGEARKAVQDYLISD